MKFAHIIALVMLLSSAFAVEQRPLASLPATVFILTDPIPGKLNQTALFEVSRGEKKWDVLFSSEVLAQKFLGSLKKEGGNDHTLTSIPRDLISEYLRNGVSFVVDPDTALSGGASLFEAPVEESKELKTICDADQTDRQPEPGKAIDWSEVEPRDKARLIRVMEMYHEGKINSASDYFRAALVLQHGAGPDDYLLAHELAIVAVKKGFGSGATWLSAASEDRFLQSIGRTQRFGTQLSTPIIVDEKVTDALRSELGVPSLIEEEKQAKSLTRR